MIRNIIALSMHIFSILYLAIPLKINELFYPRLSYAINYLENNFAGYYNLSRINISGYNFDILLISMFVYLPIYTIFLSPYLFKLIQNGIVIRQKVAVRNYVYLSLYVIIPLMYYLFMTLDIRLEETRNGRIVIQNAYIYALFLATMISVAGVLLSAMFITPIVDLRNKYTNKEEK